MGVRMILVNKKPHIYVVHARWEVKYRACRQRQYVANESILACIHADILNKKEGRR